MMRSRSLGRPGFRMLVMSRIRHAALSLNRSEPAKKGGQNIPKNRCRTTVAEPMVETRAEPPFIGDQVGCLSHNQAARLGGRRRFGQAVDYAMRQNNGAWYDCDARNLVGLWLLTIQDKAGSSSRQVRSA